MKGTMRHIAAAVLAVMMTAGLSSCIYDYERGCPSSEQIEDNNITLFLRLGILDGPATRADALDVECMSSIRIVLLDLDNGAKVEYNEKLSYADSPVIETGFILIPTLKGEKRLFFIANEESVVLGKNGEGGTLTELLDGFGVGDEGFEDAVNAAYFKLDPQKPLPMSSEYTLTAGRSGQNNLTFYVVPVATKYTFNIINEREEERSTITRIAIEDLADLNYVMPQLGQKYRTWKDSSGTETSLYWIDWLKLVCDLTSQNPQGKPNADINEALGWILDYRLPEHTDNPHDLFVGETPVYGTLSLTAGEEPVPVTFGPYYAPESKSLKSAAAPDGEQSYTLVLELTDGTGNPQHLSREMSFVQALFRNTHVVVDITIQMGYMHIYGEIRGWKDNVVYGTLTEEDLD